MPTRRLTDGDGSGWDPTWPPPSKPIPVEGGLQARSQRGRIGDSWWSQRFIAVLESFGLGGRMQRGKHYARAGQVLHMEIAPGRVTAEVQGSRVKPYRVVIELHIFTAAEWDAVESVMAASAVFLAKLLAGEMPEEIEEAFAGSSGPLFPALADAIDATCSCPDWENPCKHIAAVYFLLAEAFDRDPFLILAWRGRDKAELLAGLRRRRNAARGERRPTAQTSASGVADVEDFGWPRVTRDDVDVEALSATLRFWGRSEDIADIEIRPRRAVAPDLVLRQLDASPLRGDGPRTVDELRRLYEAITDGAVTEALGES